MNSAEFISRGSRRSFNLRESSAATVEYWKDWLDDLPNGAHMALTGSRLVKLDDADSDECKDTRSSARAAFFAESTS